MIVINCGQPNATERAVSRNLARVPGILVTNYLASAGRTVTEIDAIALTSHGCAVIEAKHSHQAGRIIPSLNAPWTIGGSPARFAGGPQPSPQSRRQALALKTKLTSNGVFDVFVTAVVAVSGPGTCQATLLGGTAYAATHVTDVARALQLVACHRPFGYADALRVLSALGIETHYTGPAATALEQLATSWDQPRGGSGPSPVERALAELSAIQHGTPTGTSEVGQSGRIRSDPAVHGATKHRTPSPGYPAGDTVAAAAAGIAIGAALAVAAMNLRRSW